MPKTRKEYRDANNGQFISDEKERRMPKSKVVRENIPLPGYGDTGRGKKKK